MVYRPTIRITCNHPNCTNSYIDTTLWRRRHGWQLTANGDDYCPDHTIQVTP